MVFGFQKAERMNTYPSSFCILDRGFAAEKPLGGDVGLEALAATVPPPPPRKGFAILPKFRVDEVTAFCAVNAGSVKVGVMIKVPVKNLPRA